MRIGSKNWAGPLVGVLLAAGIGAMLHMFIVGMGLVNLSYVLLLVSRQQSSPQEAVVVVLDEESHEQMHQPLNVPLDRSIHAALVDRLTAAGAKAIVFDVVFNDPSPNPDADRKFAEAIKRNGRVVLAADNVPIGRIGKRLDAPIDPLRDAQAAMGSAEVNPSGDLIVREHPPNTPQ